MNIIKGSCCQVQITTLDAEGAGVGLLAQDTGEATNIHVAYALPGDTVEARVTHVSPHGPKAWAELVTLKQRASERVEPRCRAFGRCGGCQLQHWHPDAQRAWKRGRLQALLAPLGIQIDAVVAAPRDFGYRSRSKLVWGRIRGQVVLGAYAPRSHDVIALDGCAIAEPPLDDVARHLAELAQSLRLSIYDPRRHAGDLRYALLRANYTGQVQLLLGVTRAGQPGIKTLAERLQDAYPSVVGVVENLQADRGDALIGRTQDDRVLSGTPHLFERIGTTQLRVSPRAFLQVNRGIAERLYQAVHKRAALTGREHVVDVYCGVGGIALTLAPQAARITGIEEEPAAIGDAIVGKKLNGAPQVHFVAGDAAKALGQLAAQREPVDVIVLNPPRKGASGEVLRACAALSPRTLLYVSCSPESLARDLTALSARGYITTDVTPFDMLPHTPHIEALATLRRTTA